MREKIWSTPWNATFIRDKHVTRYFTQTISERLYLRQKFIDFCLTPRRDWYALNKGTNSFLHVDVLLINVYRRSEKWKIRTRNIFSTLFTAFLLTYSKYIVSRKVLLQNIATIVNSLYRNEGIGKKKTCSNTIIGEFIRRRGRTKADRAARDNFLTGAPWCSDRNTDNTREILFPSPWSFGRIVIATFIRSNKETSRKSLSLWIHLMGSNSIYGHKFN